MSRSDIYQQDTGRAPDDAFEPGTLAHLVPGNRGRMLDLRRTPMRVAALRPEIGSWVCEVTGFEDAGACWTLPFESVAHFQFANESPRAGAAAIETFEAQIRRFSEPLVIVPDPERANASLAALDHRRGEAAQWLARHAPDLKERVRVDHVSRVAPEETLAAFDTFMSGLGCLTMDRAFARAWVSNPGAGEIVKGHRIVLAESGLAPFRGTIVRDPETLSGDWRKARRADHLLWRMAFVAALLEALELGGAPLYRGVSSETGLDPHRREPIESWSFSRDVAEAVAGLGGGRAQRSMQTAPLHPRRALMTYLETRAMNAPFREAEVVVIHDPAG